MRENPRIGFPSPHCQTIPSLTSNPWPITPVLARYRLVVPGPYACSTSCVRWKLVYCLCVCHGLKAHLCILPLIFDLLWHELSSYFPFFIGLLLSRVESYLIVGFSLFSPFFAPSVNLLAFLPCHCYSCCDVIWPVLARPLLGLLYAFLLLDYNDPT